MVKVKNKTFILIDRGVGNAGHHRGIVHRQAGDSNGVVCKEIAVRGANDKISGAKPVLLRGHRKDRAAGSANDRAGVYRDWNKLQGIEGVDKVIIEAHGKIIGPAVFHHRPVCHGGHPGWADGFCAAVNLDHGIGLSAEVAVALEGNMAGLINGCFPTTAGKVAEGHGVARSKAGLAFICVRLPGDPT